MALAGAGLAPQYRKAFRAGEMAQGLGLFRLQRKFGGGRRNPPLVQAVRMIAGQFLSVAHQRPFRRQNIAGGVAGHGQIRCFAQADDVLVREDLVAKLRPLLLAQRAVGQRLVELPRRKSRVAFRQASDERRAVARLNCVDDLMELLPRRILGNLPVLALPLQAPRLSFGKIVFLRVRLARGRIDPAGDDMKVAMIGVVMRDKNRERVLHSKALEKTFRRLGHLRCGRLLSLFP